MGLVDGPQRKVADLEYKISKGFVAPERVRGFNPETTVGKTAKQDQLTRLEAELQGLQADLLKAAEIDQSADPSYDPLDE